jgi:hypothetical protein
MNNKNKIGFALVIVGIGALGYYWINKTKPTITDTQQAKLQNELNNITAYGGKGDSTVQIGSKTVDQVIAENRDNTDTNWYGLQIQEAISDKLKDSNLANMKTGLEGFKVPENLKL